MALKLPFYKRNFRLLCHKLFVLITFVIPTSGLIIQIVQLLLHCSVFREHPLHPRFIELCSQRVSFYSISLFKEFVKHFFILFLKSFFKLGGMSMSCVLSIQGVSLTTCTMLHEDRAFVKSFLKKISNLF